MVTRRHFNICFVAVYVLLVVFQIWTTNVKTAYSFTPNETDKQIQRMNMYPPRFAKLGYILEVKKEVQLFGKLKENFFTVVDFMEYFPNRLPYFVSPFLIVGLYYFIKERSRWSVVYYCFLFSVVILTVFGSNAKYGPVLMYPFFLVFFTLAIQRVVNHKWT